MKKAEEIAGKKMSSVSNSWTERFCQRQRRLQEQAAVKWLGMPVGTTAEEFQAALALTGLLSKVEAEKGAQA